MVALLLFWLLNIEAKGMLDGLEAFRGVVKRNEDGMYVDHPLSFLHQFHHGGLDCCV